MFCLVIFVFCLFVVGLGGPGGGVGAPGGGFRTGRSGGKPPLLPVLKNHPQEHKNHHQDHPNQQTQNKKRKRKLNKNDV